MVWSLCGVAPAGGTGPAAGLRLPGVSTAVQRPTLVSVNQAGTNSGNGRSDLAMLSLSPDGRFVAFVSQASDLAPNDANGTHDVFVRDLQLGTTALASVNAAGTGSGNGASGVTVSGPAAVPALAISADGRFVTFTSAATDLVPNDTNGQEDVFVRDMAAGTTSLASANQAGTASGNGRSTFPSISANGTVVVYRSNASDLTANDTDAVTDVFAYSVATGTTTLVSVNQAGTASGNGVSVFNTVSDDGRYVAFTSTSNDLVANDTNGAVSDVFLRDLQEGATALISVTADGAGSGNGVSGVPIVAAGGRHVLFTSRATNLVAVADTNQSDDVFVRDVEAGLTHLVSVNREGTATGAGGSYLPSALTISPDGRYVAFLSDASDLVPNDANGFMDVFVRDIADEKTTLVTVNVAGTGSAELGGSFGSPINISADGRFVVFDSISSDLTSNDDDTVHNGTSNDVFLRDLQNSTTTLLSVNAAGISGNHSSFNPLLSRDGKSVVFVSLASDLVENDTNNQQDIFAYTTSSTGDTEGLQYYPLARPVRLLDTRPGQTACFTPGSPLQASASLTQPAALTCEGLSIPPTARAIVGNATVVNTTPAAAPGFVTLYPSGTERPTASNLNYVPGQIVPNSFTVSLSDAGSFDIFAFSETHLVVDITGYFAPPGQGGLFYHPLPRPVRLLDTRIGQTACFAPGSPLAGGAALTQTARTTCDGLVIPEGAVAVVGNATVVNNTPAAASGFVTLHPSGTERPTASNLNYVEGQIVPNSFTVGLGAAGSFEIFALSETHFIVDITGYYSSTASADSNGAGGLHYYGLGAPARLLDTRPGQTACFTPGSPLAGGADYPQQARVSCAGQDVPASAQAVVGNATVVNTVAGAGSGFVTLYPGGEGRPVASNLNYVGGEIVANSFVVRVGGDGGVMVFPLTTTHFIVDLSGYFAP